MQRFVNRRFVIVITGVFQTLISNSKIPNLYIQHIYQTFLSRRYGVYAYRDNRYKGLSISRRLLAGILAGNKGKITNLITITPGIYNIGAYGDMRFGRFEGLAKKALNRGVFLYAKKAHPALSNQKTNSYK